MQRRTFLLQAAAVGSAVAAPVVHAQAWPSRPIRFVIPFPPGGTSDIFVRTLIPKMSEVLGQNLVVDYKAGASGTIGLDAVARAAPDGYTIGLGSPGGLVAVPHMLTTKVPYDTERDFTFLALLARVPSALVTSNTSGYNTVKDVIDKARAAPGTLHYGHPGQGTLVHLVAELFKREARLDITPVPFKGGAATAQATIGNQVPFGWLDVSAGWNQISGGLLKTLAVTGARRSPVLPNVPTLAESGLPNAVMEADYGVLAPAGLPPDVQARISAALNAAMEAPAVRDAYHKVGATMVAAGPREYREAVQQDYRKWGAFIREQKITVQ